MRLAVALYTAFATAAPTPVMRNVSPKTKLRRWNRSDLFE